MIASKGKAVITGTKPQKEAENLGGFKALFHYIGGSQKEVEVAFKMLRTQGVTPEQFKKVANLIHIAGFDGVDGEYFVEDSMNYKGPGFDNYLAIGNVKLLLQGTLTISNMSYTFSGTLSAADNLYDFDPAENFNERWRSAPAEILTVMGSWLPEKPYNMKFIGSREIQSKGKIEPWY
ncbi:hypothetical protein [Aliikangiella maris]|uniref:Uncharacterized protein n=2 Tax=Aliikangiella maris TaxID=3162458 RepID=A0ABV3MV83_9GAMM